MTAFAHGLRAPTGRETCSEPLELRVGGAIQKAQSLALVPFAHPNTPEIEPSVLNTAAFSNPDARIKRTTHATEEHPHAGFLLQELVSDVRHMVSLFLEKGFTETSTDWRVVSSASRFLVSLSPAASAQLDATDLSRMRKILGSSSRSTEESVITGFELHGKPTDYDALASALLGVLWQRHLLDRDAVIVVPGKDYSSLHWLSLRLGKEEDYLFDLLRDAGFSLVTREELHTLARNEGKAAEIVRVDWHSLEDNRFSGRDVQIPHSGSIDAHTAYLEELGYGGLEDRLFLTSRVRATASALLALLVADTPLGEVEFWGYESESALRLALSLSLIGIITDCGLDTPGYDTAQQGDLLLAGFLAETLRNDEDEILSGFIGYQRKRLEMVCAITSYGMTREVFDSEGGVFCVVDKTKYSFKLDEDILGQLSDYVLASHPSAKEVWVLAAHTDPESKEDIWKLSVRARCSEQKVDKRIKQILGEGNAGGSSKAGGGTLTSEFIPVLQDAHQGSLDLLYNDLQNRCLTRPSRTSTTSS